MKTLIFTLFFWIFNSITVSGNLECNQAFLGREGHGVIQSYNYPFHYRHNLTCRYRIHLNQTSPTTAKTLCFTFHRFDLEGSTPFCSYDFVKFSNIKYCGHGLWQYGGATDSPESNVWFQHFCWTVKDLYFDILFESDNNLNGAGFYASYTVTDGAITQQPPSIGSKDTAPCTPEQWTCFNRKCIPRNQTCDGKDDCGDGSDESYAHSRCGEQNLMACDFTVKGSFSDAYCGFSNERGQWYRTDKRISEFGPPGDHTNGTSGHYVYTDVGESPVYLVSPEITLQKESSYCLSFWYFVYGRPASAELTVFIARDQAYTRPEWYRKKAEADNWIQGQISLNNITAIQVIFGAELDNSMSGVALDDISVLPNACQGADIACNFESGTCGWKTTAEVDGLKSELTWKTQTRLNSDVGPIHDTSSKDGSGKYLFINSAQRRSQDLRALLLSPTVSSFEGEKKCLSFWYYIAGIHEDCCILRVRVVDVYGKAGQMIWSQQGEQLNKWKIATVDLEFSSSFQFLLEGVISEGTSGEIAVDQILLTSGECANPSTSLCLQDEYLCSTGECVNRTKVCDTVNDCSDGSDEDWRGGCKVTTTPPAPTLCPVSYFRCRSDGACIPESWVCDTFADCSDSSDEGSQTGCPDGPIHPPSPTEQSSTPFCSGPDLYRCKNLRCVSMSSVCDGRDHCGDNSDEGSLANCADQGAHNTFCREEEFHCEADRRCITKDKLCDGTAHCSDSADEDYKRCSSYVSAMRTPLTVGEIVGIVVAFLVLILLVVTGILLYGCKKKRKQSGTEVSTQDVSTISYTEDNSMQGLNVGNEIDLEISPVGPPPYTERDQSNSGYIHETVQPGGSGDTLTGGEGTSEMPPLGEPPPPYDTAVKDPVVVSNHFPYRPRIQTNPRVHGPSTSRNDFQNRRPDSSYSQQHHPYRVQTMQSPYTQQHLPEPSTSQNTTPRSHITPARSSGRRSSHRRPHSRGSANYLNQSQGSSNYLDHSQGSINYLNQSQEDLSQRGRMSRHGSENYLDQNNDEPHPQMNRMRGVQVLPNRGHGMLSNGPSPQSYSPRNQNYHQRDESTPSRHVGVVVLPNRRPSLPMGRKAVHSYHPSGRPRNYENQSPEHIPLCQSSHESLHSRESTPEGNNIYSEPDQVIMAMNHIRQSSSSSMPSNTDHSRQSSTSSRVIQPPSSRQNMPLPPIPVEDNPSQTTRPQQTITNQNEPGVRLDSSEALGQAYFV